MRKTGARAMAFAGALLAVGVLAAACTNASPNVGKGNGKVTGKPLKGGTVTVAEVGASPNFIFPYPPSTNSDGYNVNLTQGLWPYLVYAGDGAKATVNPDESLFSSLKYSNNNSVITIVLKPVQPGERAAVEAALCTPGA
jgi:peptide/nickel transport system substrate-binding protein